MTIRAFKIQPPDNVATLLDDALAGPAQVLGAGQGTVQLPQPIGMGHKVALVQIPQGHPIIKFGIPIGTATREINAGEWVHLHNCASTFDQRSQTLDVQTGAVTDTRYE